MFPPPLGHPNPLSSLPPIEAASFGLGGREVRGDWSAGMEGGLGEDVYALRDGHSSRLKVKLVPTYHHRSWELNRMLCAGFPSDNDKDGGFRKDCNTSPTHQLLKEAGVQHRWRSVGWGCYGVLHLGIICM